MALQFMAYTGSPPTTKKILFTGCPEGISKSLFRTSWDVLTGSSQDTVKSGRKQCLPPIKKIFLKGNLCKPYPDLTVSCEEPIRIIHMINSRLLLMLYSWYIYFSQSWRFLQVKSVEIFFENLYCFFHMLYT